MIRIKFSSIMFFGFVLCSCGQIPDPLRNRIELTDEIRVVSDSLICYESLLKKLPDNGILNAFVDHDGYLYVNEKKLVPLKEALNNSSVKADSVFSNFSDNDYERFIGLTIFLLRNHLSLSMRDNRSGYFVHAYRQTLENSYVDIRDIMVNVDTTSPKFVKQYQILDQKENMILVAPIDVDVK